MVVFCAGVAGIILGSMKSSWACSQELDLARHDKNVVEKLGEPIETGWLVSGSINVAGPSGNADLAVPLHGTHNMGTLYVVAHKVAGEGQFSSFGQLKYRRQSKFAPSMRDRLRRRMCRPLVAQRITHVKVSP